MIYTITLLSHGVQASLWLMLQGMLGIFMFMTLFYLLIYALERMFPARKES